jgi:benzoyl-CoA-dihydrodiol lyase
MKRIDFQTSPDKYRHWRIEPQGEVAKVIMDVDEMAVCSTDMS